MSTEQTRYSVGVWYGERGNPVFDLYTDSASELTEEEADEICAAFWRLDDIDVDRRKVTTEPICLASTRADADRLPEDIAREWMRETYDFTHHAPTQAGRRSAGCGMTRKRLQEIESRHAAASSGPWETKFSTHHKAKTLIRNSTATLAVTNAFDSPEQALANADFIAHAHQDVRDLLDEIARLRGAQ